MNEDLHRGLLNGGSNETTPFKANNVRVEDEDDFLDDDVPTGTARGLAVEVNRLLALALPLSGQNLLAYSLSLISVGFIGHLGKYELSVAVLATSLYNLTGNSVVQGMAGGMETLCGQAFGAGSYRQVGEVLQRALAILMLFALCVIAVWSQAEPLLIALGQNAELAAGAARYIHIISPALIMLVVCETLKRYLMTQGVVHPPLVITSLVTVLSPLYNWLFIYYFDLHLDGAALAFDAQIASIAIMLLVYVLVRDSSLKGQPNQTWFGWCREAFVGWDQYLGLALPSCGMVCLEWWIFEGVILLAGRLPDPEVSVSVMGICMNTISCIYMLPLGLGAATSTRVSNYLGANFPDNARACARVAIVMCFIITLGTCTGVVAFRDVLAYLFTSDATVVEHTARVLPILAAALLGDALLATLAGVLRGCGRQVVGAVMNAVAYWGVGFPLAYYLAFPRALGTRGLWLGLATVTTLQSCVIGTYVALIDWDKEADVAMDRVLTMSTYASGYEGARQHSADASAEPVIRHAGEPLPSPRTQPLPSPMGGGSMGAHPLSFSYGSYTGRGMAVMQSIGSTGGSHRVLAGAVNASQQDLESQYRRYINHPSNDGGRSHDSSHLH